MGRASLFLIPPPSLTSIQRRVLSTSGSFCTPCIHPAPPAPAAAPHTPTQLVRGPSVQEYSNRAWAGGRGLFFPAEPAISAPLPRDAAHAAAPLQRPRRRRGKGGRGGGGHTRGMTSWDGDDIMVFGFLLALLSRCVQAPPTAPCVHAYVMANGGAASSVPPNVGLGLKW